MPEQVENKSPSTGKIHWGILIGGLVPAMALLCVMAYAARVPLLLAIPAVFVAGVLFCIYAAFSDPMSNRGGAPNIGIVAGANLRSPNRPFMDRVREPDADFPVFLMMLTRVVPWTILSFGLGTFVIRIMVEAAFGQHSLVTTEADAVVQFIFRATVPVVVVAYVALWCLRAYVSAQLRRESDHAPDNHDALGLRRGPTLNHGSQPTPKEGAAEP